ncbi:MAG: hypothetical protein ACT4QF_02090 [Sporichthyaceae bacterium]
MGLFGTYLHADGGWSEIDPENPPAEQPDGPWLILDVYDSDIGTIHYAPSGSATGEAFLGFTPRVYFENPHASAPTDRRLEAAGLAQWAQAVTGRPVLADVEAFLACDELEGDDDLDPQDEAEIFVEVKAARLFAALGLPAPEALTARR